MRSGKVSASTSSRPSAGTPMTAAMRAPLSNHDRSGLTGVSVP